MVNALSAVDKPRVLVVRVDQAGDFSTYRLSLVNSPTDSSTPAGFDTELAALDFSFKIDCPSDFDCRSVRDCAQPEQPAPDIDYLVKDYPGFRRLMLGHIAQLAPQWVQGNEADTGVALVELLAYAGDQLSYRQDAIGTEAYLDTARRRISLRRHALLVDYPMHDGCNARTWLHLRLEAGVASCTLPYTGIQFLTSVKGYGAGIEAGSLDQRNAMLQLPTVFEPIADPRFAQAGGQPLYAAHNQIRFYTWSGRRCCLPAGATAATLQGQFPDLRAHDVLLLEEVMGPLTGVAGDRDPGHRQVVRLTTVTPLKDDLTQADITAIEWGADDALKFPLCISGLTDQQHGAQYLSAISVARGNLVLIDHGSTQAAEPLSVVPAPTLYALPDCTADRCNPAAQQPIPVRYRPALAQGPLTQAGTVVQSGSSERVPFDPTLPASAALSWAIGDVLPQITLAESVGGKLWNLQRSLLESNAESVDYLVETDDNGTGILRFGDDEYGKRPPAGLQFKATYRVGNGSAGNVGADSIVHVVGPQTLLGAIHSVHNPFAAGGGIDPESADSVRRNAPQAFRTQERAVTPDDYAAVTGRYPGVYRAAAAMRWTGSWHTPFISVEPDAGVDAGTLKQALLPFVDVYRMAGEDLDFRNPAYVSLRIGLHVCLQDDYFRADVKAALLQLFSNRLLADGSKGLFYPDKFSFGQTVYLSPLYAAAHAIPGVARVQVTEFGRLGDDDPLPLLRGYLAMAPLEIARLDNDPNFPERGVLDLDVLGGK